MENVSEIKALLSEPKNVVLTSHRNPDGDAIGSTLALCRYLRLGGHKLSMMFPSEYPKIFEWMPSIEEILIYDIHELDCQKKLDDADIIFSLDYNSLDRVDKMGKYISELEGKYLVLIDHHLYPDNYTDFSLTDVKASSTSELVYLFIDLLGDKGKIDKDIADALMTGILTDTGSLAYNVRPDLFNILSEMFQYGIDYQQLQDLLFQRLEEKHLRLLGHCLANRMEILEEYKTGIIWLNKEDYQKFKIQRGDTEGIVNYLLKLDNVNFAVFITEQPKIVKLSFRSKGDFNVQEIATKYFKGGGHKNASGGSSKTDLNDTLELVKSILPLYKSKLI